MSHHLSNLALSYGWELVKKDANMVRCIKQTVQQADAIWTPCSRFDSQTINDVLSDPEIQAGHPESFHPEYGGTFTDWVDVLSQLTVTGVDGYQHFNHPQGDNWANGPCLNEGVFSQNDDWVAPESGPGNSLVFSSNLDQPVGSTEPTRPQHLIALSSKPEAGCHLSVPELNASDTRWRFNDGSKTYCLEFDMDFVCPDFVHEGANGTGYLFYETYDGNQRGPWISGTPNTPQIALYVWKDSSGDFGFYAMNSGTTQPHDGVTQRSYTVPPPAPYVNNFEFLKIAPFSCGLHRWKVIYRPDWTGVRPLTAIFLDGNLVYYNDTTVNSINGSQPWAGVITHLGYYRLGTGTPTDAEVHLYGWNDQCVDTDLILPA